MRRRRSSQTTLTPSLFPFLAVLICTMGALIALLVLGVQQAHVHAEVVVQQQQSRNKDQQQEKEEEERLKREDLIWQQEILEAAAHQENIPIGRTAFATKSSWKSIYGNSKVTGSVCKRKCVSYSSSGEQRQDQSQDWQQQLTDLEQQIKQAQEQLERAASTVRKC